MRIALSCLTCLLLAAPAARAAQAQTAAPPGDSGAPPAPAAGPAREHPSLRSLDTNHDGMISREEAQARRGLSRRFAEIDGNHDGQLDRDELRAWHQQMKARRGQRQQGGPTAQPTLPPPDASSGGPG